MFLINIEKEMHFANLEKEGGYNGWRNFTIGKISEESKEIKLFFLYPTDGKKIADYKAGQYVGVQVYVKEIEILQDNIAFLLYQILNSIGYL